MVTMHRRENQGEPMRRVFKVMRQVIDSHPDVEIIYPVHLSPRVQKVANEVLGGDPRIHLIEPLDVVDFHNLAKRSYFIMTDSGGVQEEAPSLGKPVLVLRDTTERPEGVKAGGKLALQMRKLKVKALYNEIPERLTINVSHLGLGKTIKVGELHYEGLELLNAKEAVVCAVKLTRAARGAAAAANN